VGDVKGGARSARAGTRATSVKTGIRRRAVGTRDRIISYLGSITDISDPGGMASTKLAEAVGYPGSSVAFAQLLSGMERDGLISREVRGKRTYRIILAPGVHPGEVSPSRVPAGSGYAQVGVASGAARGRVAQVAKADVAAADFDYDELARRLLVQVIRRLATPPEGQEEVVADLERELAMARTRASSLTAENRKLREQLSLARFSLDQARQGLDLGDLDLERRALNQGGPVGEELSDAEVVLLERLVSAPRDAVEEEIQPGATALLAGVHVNPEGWRAPQPRLRRVAARGRGPGDWCSFPPDKTDRTASRPRSELSRWRRAASAAPSASPAMTARRISSCSEFASSSRWSALARIDWRTNPEASPRSSVRIAPSRGPLPKFSMRTWNAML
jgi:hypothetical protein